MGYGMKYTKTMAKATGKGFPFMVNDDIEQNPIGNSPAHDMYDSPAQEGELVDLRPNDKNIDLDKGENMPVKTSGFGPREDANLGSMMGRELENTTE